jgi:PTH1 family peptidyl-tRNA hydrolase
MPDSEAQGLRLVAGLGNPGREYEGTRHNAGFAVIDLVAANLGAVFCKEPKWDAMVARVPGSDLVLIKPTTFMNLSGESVSAYARFHRIPHASVLVAADDVALPPGTIRLRREGGAGGQKGLESVLVHFATEQVPRLRIGVGGASSGADLSGHVLSRFRPEELPLMEEAVSRAATAVIHAVENGIESAMNLYNALPVPDKSKHQQTEQP